MPVCLDHHANDVLDVAIGHVGLEEIAHAVHKHCAWPGPLERLRYFFRHQPKVKSLLVRMPLYASRAFGEGFRIAMLAARTDLSTSPERIPRCISPLDF